MFTPKTIIVVSAVPIIALSPRVVLSYTLAQPDNNVNSNNKRILISKFKQTTKCSVRFSIL